MIKRIYIFGDSIIFGSNDWVFGGWANRLKIYFAKTGKFHHVFNLGISGENSDNILQRIEGEIGPRKSMNPDIKDLTIIGVPINDTRYPLEKSGKIEPEINLQKFKENLKRFKKITKKNSSKLVFVGMTRVDNKKTIPWSEGQKEICWNNKVIKKYDEVVEKFCKDRNIHFIGLFDLLSNNNFPDGLHPDETGHEKMFEKIKNFLIDKKLINEI